MTSPNPVPAGIICPIITFSLNPKRAIIFGSSVRLGLKARDIDILIISDYFKNILWQDRTKLFNISSNLSFDLRLYTQQEFDAFFPLTTPIRDSIEKENINLVDIYERF